MRADSDPPESKIYADQCRYQQRQHKAYSHSWKVEFDTKPQGEENKEQDTGANDQGPNARGSCREEYRLLISKAVNRLVNVKI